QPTGFEIDPGLTDIVGKALAFIESSSRRSRSVPLVNQRVYPWHYELLPGSAIESKTEPVQVLLPGRHGDCLPERRSAREVILESVHARPIAEHHQVGTRSPDLILGKLFGNICLLGTTPDESCCKHDG